jgi:hypothetical protein
MERQHNACVHVQGFVIRVLVTMHMTWYMSLARSWECIQCLDGFVGCHSLSAVCRLVNSVVHIWGTQPYKTNDESRNNWLVAFLVFGPSPKLHCIPCPVTMPGSCTKAMAVVHVCAGDGWHNNHHAFQDSAAHGLEWWQFDMSYYLVRCFTKLVTCFVWLSYLQYCITSMPNVT